MNKHIVLIIIGAFLLMLTNTLFADSSVITNDLLEKNYLLSENNLNDLLRRLYGSPKYHAPNSEQLPKIEFEKNEKIISLFSQSWGRISAPIEFFSDGKIINEGKTFHVSHSDISNFVKEILKFGILNFDSKIIALKKDLCDKLKKGNLEKNGIITTKPIISKAHMTDGEDITIIISLSKISIHKEINVYQIWDDIMKYPEIIELQTFKHIYKKINDFGKHIITT